MKSLASLATALICASTAQAAELPVKLPDGASWTLQVERERSRERGSRPPQASKLVTEMRLSWRAEGDDGGGRLTATTVAADAGPLAAPEDVMAALGQARPVVMDVDAALTPERIRNWDEVRGDLEAAVAKLAPDPKMTEMAKGLFGGLSDVQAAQVVMRDLGLVAIGQGTALELGDAFDYEDRLPNPLGGPPIATKGRFELVSFDAAKGEAVVEWRQAFDPDAAAASLAVALEALMAQASPEQAPRVKSAFEGAKVDRKDHCRHQIHVPTGLAVRVACTSTIDVTVQGETGRNVDRWTITQTLPRTSP